MNFSAAFTAAVFSPTAMSTLATMPLSQGRMGVRRKRNFSFNKGDLVLVKWADGMVYFAKIKHVYHRREKCVVVFDDKSQDEADFSQIHSVDETTTDIICIKCKKDDSELPNEIVLCDKCGIGFHQKCHNPIIPASALQLDSPWNCSYCQRGTKCPYLTESLDVLQNLLSDDNESMNEEEECNGVESEKDDNVAVEDSSRINSEKKKKGLHVDEKKSSAVNDRKRNLRGSTPTTLSSLATTERTATKPLGDVPNHKDSSFSEEEDGTTVENVTASRKRKKYTPLHHKRQKRPSVESHTVSVTRLNSPIFADGINIAPTSKEKEGDSKSNPLKSKHEKRSLRVSLSLPDEMDKRRYLKSPFSCNGDSTVRSDSVSPTAESMKVSPCDNNNPATGFGENMETQENGVFTATALPVESSENHVDPTSSSEIQTPSIDAGVTSSTEQPQSIAVNSSCNSPTTEMPADSSTTGKCGSNTANSLVSATSSSKSTDSNLNTDDSSKEINCNNGDTIGESVAVAPIPSDNADDAVIPVPTTLPVVIERSVCYLKSNDGLISPTKAIISSGDCACEAGDSSCAQLTPGSTTSTGNFQISQCSEEMDIDQPDGKVGSAITTSLAYSNDEKSQDQDGSVQNKCINSVTQSTTDEPKDDSSESVQPVQANTSVNGNDIATSSAPTSVITSSSPTSKPQNHLLESASGANDHMSKLDKQLAAVIGYEEPGGPQGEGVETDRDLGSQTQMKTLFNESDKSSATSKVVETKSEEVGQNKECTAEARKAVDSRGSASTIDPDVIITSVEPSIENNRRQSASSRPSEWVVTNNASRPTMLPGQTSMEAMAGPPPGDKNKLPPPYPSHSTDSASVKSQNQSSSVHTTRAVYSSSSRVPMAYHSRAGSVVYTPNGPVFYAPVQHEGTLKQACVPNLPAGVATSKPYAIVNGVTPSSGDNPFPRGVEGGRHYVVYKDGVCQQVIPAPCALMVSPDSTAEAESTSGTNEEKDLQPRKKFAPKDIQYIQQKVGDACNSYDIKMFMAAFNDAWDKFQANASNYQDQAAAATSRLALGQAPDGSHQVHLVSTKPRVVAPKLSSSTTGSVSTPSPTVVQIPPANTGTQKNQQKQQQYFLQQVTPASHYPPVYGVSAPTHHACTSSSSTNPGCPPPQTTESPPITHAQSEKKSSSVAQTLPAPPMTGPNKAPRLPVNHFKTKLMGSAKPAAKPESLPNKSNKNCTRCGTPATYLCSGCRKVWYCGRECQTGYSILRDVKCNSQIDICNLIQEKTKEAEGIISGVWSPQAF